MTQNINRAIATANSALIDAGLPSYSQTVDVLRYLLQQARLSDLERDNHAVGKAQDLIDDYTGKYMGVF